MKFKQTRETKEEDSWADSRRMFRPYKLAECMEQVREWRKSGMTIEEAKNSIDRRVLIDSDVDEVYNEIMPELESLMQERIAYLKEEELIDYENQPFSTDNKEDNEILINSIKLNGIIEPIVVRPYNEKYQILSGHRRRKCGREAGLTEFPCLIKNKNDNEATLYLVDTNLGTRNEIKPTERAKAYLLRKEALKDENLKNKLDKIEQEIVDDNSSTLNLRITLQKENNISNRKFTEIFKN